MDGGQQHQRQPQPQPQRQATSHPQSSKGKIFPNVECIVLIMKLKNQLLLPIELNIVVHYIIRGTFHNCHNAQEYYCVPPILCSSSSSSSSSMAIACVTPRLGLQIHSESRQAGMKYVIAAIERPTDRSTLWDSFHSQFPRCLCTPIIGNIFVLYGVQYTGQTDGQVNR